MFGWLETYSRGFRLRILLSTAAGILKVGGLLLFVYASKQLIDVVTGISSASFGKWATLMVIAISVELAADALSTGIGKVCAVKLQNRLRAQLFTHLLATRWQGREEHHSGDTMNRLERDVKEIAEFITTQLPSFLVTGVQFCSAFLFLLLLDSRLAWLLVGIVPLCVAFSKLWYRRMKRLSHSVRNCDSSIQSHLQECIQHRLVLKTHRSLPFVTQRLDTLQELLLAQSLTHTRFTLFTRTLLLGGFTAGYLLTFIYGAWQIQLGAITYGMMVAFLQLVGQIQGPASQLASVVPQFITASTAADRLSELQQLENETHGSEQPLTAPCGIRIEHLTFGYDAKESPLFRDFSWDFPPGSKTLLTGETGVGKTTLFRLILGLTLPQQGTIHVYNAQQTIPATPLTRTNFIYVPQGNSLFSGTLRDNLLLGNPDATDEQLHEVLHIAAAAFVSELPEGLDTVCGEGGGVLSEGQAQRIAIARALLGHGSVMLFDEFTSALDPHTEQLLLERLATHYPDRTMLFISHHAHLSASGYQECVLLPQD